MQTKSTSTRSQLAIPERAFIHSDFSPGADSRVLEVKLKILVRLITRIQAWYRGRKARLRVAKLRQHRKEKDLTEQKMEAIRQAVFKAARDRNHIKAHGRSNPETLEEDIKATNPPASQKIPEPTASSKVAKPPVSPKTPKYRRSEKVQPVPLAAAAVVEPERIDEVVTPVLPTPTVVAVSPIQAASTPRILPSAAPPADKEQSEVLTPPLDITMQQEGGLSEEDIEAIDLIKASILAFESQAALMWLEANILVSQAAHSIDHPSRFQGPVEEIVTEAPIELILPQDVEGVIAHGVVVDESSPIRGASVHDPGWAFTEIDDTEVYELQPFRIHSAASKIQRIFRRFMTRRKFISYIQEKDVVELPTVLEETTAASLPTGTQETINTDACVIS